jgi:hypothetical protein
MKLEPVAWQFRFKHNLGEWRGCSSGDALLYGNLAECETRDLYAIPDGYVVVPVEDAEDARLGRFVKNFDVQTLELTLERMKYVFSHPEEFPVPPAKEQS